MSKPTRIIVAEASDVIRRGIAILLKETVPFAFVLSEIAEAEPLRQAMAGRYPDIFIVNPAFPGLGPLHQLKKERPGMRCVMLQTSLADAANPFHYDEFISLYDSAGSIREKLVRLVEPPEASVHRESLSQREKDIVVCVVKGMTNKQIADKLCLSPHTVNTHRRNISSKLDIHSTSGLTIYAISKKLVRLDDLDGKY